MFYIYRVYSIAGWIFAAAFFLFLAGFALGERRARKRAGFEVFPVKESDEKQS